MGPGSPAGGQGTDLATLVDRAVIVPMEPAVYPGPFLASVPRYDN